MITASLATIPSRRHTLEKVVRRLLDQVDHLNVYLNETPALRGKANTIPSFLRHPKITAVCSQDTEYGDRGDAGKFYWASEVKGWHIVCDDDVLYPENFVSTLIAGAEKYQRRCAVGFHGAVLVEPLTSYYNCRQVSHFANAVPRDVPVHILASNSLCYHTDTIKVHRDDFKHANMGDIWFGLLAQEQAVPLICLKHAGGWMMDDTTTRADSIYAHSKSGVKSTKNTADVQTATVQMHAPWRLRDATGRVVSSTGQPIPHGETCSLCGFTGKYGTYRGRGNAQCPTCGSLRRHRRQATWLDGAGVTGPVLHVAPNGALSKKLHSYGAYTSMDLRPEVGTTVVGDLRSMAFEDGTFGLLVVSHVLEHIEAVDSAIAECFRVLKPGGHAILDVPYFDRPTTRSIPRDRHDHVWEPGKDWADRYRVAGFEVLKEHAAGTTLCRKPAQGWPEKKPNARPNDHGWLAEGTEKMLRRHLRAEMQVIVELGVWLGKSTRFFLKQCPDATVFSVDLWDATHLTQWASSKHPHLVEAAKNPLDTFLVNLWENQDRVVPIQMDSIKAIAKLKADGVEPDLIYLDTSHLYPETLREVEAIKAAFPEVPLVGDDWEWQNKKHGLAVQRSVNEYVAAHPEWAVESDGNGWALVNSFRESRGTGFEGACMSFLTVRGPQHEAVIQLEAHSHMGTIITGSGTYYEHDLLMAILAKGREGVYIDVGAHVGNHTTFFALECPSTRVIAIEPHPAAVAGLQATVTHNNIVDRVQVLHGAIHNTWKTTTAHFTDDRRCIISQDGGAAPCFRLDDIVTPDDRVAVIKVDVDGLEGNVLTSGAEMIQRDHPLLALEAWTPETLEETRAVLEPWGYVQGQRYCRTPTYLWEWAG